MAASKAVVPSHVGGALAGLFGFNRNVLRSPGHFGDSECRLRQVARNLRLRCSLLLDCCLPATAFTSLTVFSTSTAFTVVASLAELTRRQSRHGGANFSNASGRGSDGRQHPLRRQWRLVYFGTQGGKRVTHCIRDRRRRSDRTTFSHSLHPVLRRGRGCV